MEKRPEMIVLDEQLLGHEIREEIASWYRGTVVDITMLRPGTHILDDAIQALLRTVRQPTFITLNASDFWRRMAPDPHSCIIGFALSHLQASLIPILLRRLLSLEPFRTRRSRVGKIVRVTTNHIQYYTDASWAIQTLDWPQEK